MSAQQKTRTQTMHIIPHRKNRDIEKTKNPQNLSTHRALVDKLLVLVLETFQILAAKWNSPHHNQPCQGPYNSLLILPRNRVFPIWQGYAQKRTEESLHMEKKSPQ